MLLKLRLNVFKASDKQTNRQTDRQTNRQTDKQTHLYCNKCLGTPHCGGENKHFTEVAVLFITISISGGEPICTGVEYYS